MSKCFIFVVAILVCIFSVVGSVKAVIIDPFDTTPQTQTNVGSTGPIAAAEAIGGFRTLEILSKAGSLNLGAELRVLGQAYPADLLTLSNDVGTSSIAQVTWDGGPGGMDVDLSAALADAILLDFVSLDVGQIDFTVTITDTVASGADTATMVINDAALGTNVFAFDTFTNFANVDFSSVQVIKLMIDAEENSDLSLRLFSTREFDEVPVPEPATVLLLGIGLVGLGGGYLRKRIKRS